LVKKIFKTMPTIKQLIKNPRLKKILIKKTPALEKCPYKKGTCLKLIVRAPKKTEFSFKKSNTSKINKQQKSFCLYSRRRS